MFFLKMRDARTIDPAALYDRRKQVVKLYKKSYKINEIATIAGVNRDTVSKWIKIYHQGGLAQLRPKSKAVLPVVDVCLTRSRKKKFNTV